MKAVKKLFAVLTLLTGVLFVYQSELKAQSDDQEKTSNLSAIKDRRKVYLSTKSIESKNKMAQALAGTNLEIVDKPEDAEFFIAELVDVTFTADTPSNLQDQLERLQTPGAPQSEVQKRAIDDAGNPAKKRNLMIRKTTIQVYFIKDDGTKVTVWLKDARTKLSSTPQTTVPTNPSSGTLPPEASLAYKPKDDAGKLTKSFAKKLKALN